MFSIGFHGKQWFDVLNFLQHRLHFYAMSRTYITAAYLRCNVSDHFTELLGDALE
jgi:hypothetical protein